MSTTAEIIKKPTNRRAGAVANPGMAMKIGDKKMAARNSRPVTTEESPVLPPSATPAELSTKVVVVEVPSTAPAVVATASASSACLIRGSLPSLSIMPALVAHPISVPMVSKISTNRKENTMAIKSKILKVEKSALKHCPNTEEIAPRLKLLHAGIREY